MIRLNVPERCKSSLVIIFSDIQSNAQRATFPNLSLMACRVSVGKGTCIFFCLCHLILTHVLVMSCHCHILALLKLEVVHNLGKTDSGPFEKMEHSHGRLQGLFLDCLFMAPQIFPRTAPHRICIACTAMQIMQTCTKMVMLASVPFETGPSQHSFKAMNKLFVCCRENMNMVSATPSGRHTLPDAFTNLRNHRDNHGLTNYNS